MNGRQAEAQQEGPRHKWVVPTAFGLSAFGLVLTATTVWLDHTFWLSSVLVNLGTTLLLAFPLAWLGHLLTSRIQQSQRATEIQISSVRDEVEDVQSDLDELREETKKSISELQEEYSRSLAEDFENHTQKLIELRNEPTLDLLRTVLDRSMGTNTSNSGMIFDYHEKRLFCRFRQDVWSLGGMAVEVSDQSFKNPGVRLEFGGLDSVDLLYTRINESLSAQNLLSPDEFQIGRFFNGIADSIEAFEACKRIYYPDEIGNAIVAPNHSWIITDEGLVSQTHRYGPLFFKENQPQGEGWMFHMQQKPWVDYDDLWEAMNWVIRLGLAKPAWVDGTKRPS